MNIKYFAFTLEDRLQNIGGAGLTRAKILEIYSNAENIREIASDAEVPVGELAVLYKEDFSPKTQAELASEGLDAEGKALPSAEERAEQQRREQLEKERQDLQRKAMLAEGFVRREKEAAKQQAIDELVGERAAAILGANPKLPYIETAEQNAEEFAQQAAALAQEE